MTAHAEFADAYLTIIVLAMAYNSLMEDRPALVEAPEIQIIVQRTLPRSAFLSFSC